VISVKNLSPHHLRWPKRPQKIATDAGFAYLWNTRCRLYRVRRSVIRHLPDKFYAQYRHPVTGCWDVISTHRKLRAALAACEGFAGRTHRYLDVTEDSHETAD